MGSNQRDKIPETIGSSKKASIFNRNGLILQELAFDYRIGQSTHCIWDFVELGKSAQVYKKPLWSSEALSETKESSEQMNARKKKRGVQYPRMQM